jgi:O-antigen ligase
MGATILYIAGAPLIAGVATHFFHPHQMAGTIAKQSWAARMDIWRFAVSEIDQRPFWGWGLEASRAWPSIIPMHPHNAALQIWLELGVLGVTAAALFWAWLYWRIALLHVEDRSMAAAAAASAVAYLTIGAISFGVWQEWWLALGALSVVMCRLVAASRRLEPGDTLVPLATLAQTSTV